MTEKIYYSDAYISEFTARVLSCEACEGGFDTVLDRTAFFPEEGGQSSDSGTIGGVAVLHVSECDGRVHHLTESPIFGDVECKINFAERFEKMQLHTAEHIVCGVIHRLFGLENVGFHLGADAVTFDISAPLSREELDRAELLANEAVFANLTVEAFFPTPKELESMTYRSKLDIKEGVRIVRIGDVDSCACCAPHVQRTGEIGMIKLLDAEKHRGGMRIILVAGPRALADYREKYTSVRRISAMLSTPQSDVADTLTEYMKENESLKYKLNGVIRELTLLRAEGIPKTQGSLAVFFEDTPTDSLREIANYAAPRVNGMLAVLSGVEGEYRYVIVSDSTDVGTAIREINSRLNGKGGGRGRMVQGTFRTTATAIKEYFSSLN